MTFDEFMSPEVTEKRRRYYERCLEIVRNDAPTSYAVHRERLLEIKTMALFELECRELGVQLADEEGLTEAAADDLGSAVQMLSYIDQLDQMIANGDKLFGDGA